MITNKTVFCLMLTLINLSESQKSSEENISVTAKLKALYPKGVRAQIFVNVTAKFLFFDGILYDNMENALFSNKDIGLIMGSGIKQQGNLYEEWLFEDPNANLKVGQVLKYGVFVSDVNPTGTNVDGQASLKFKGVVSDYKYFKVTVLEDPLVSMDIPCLPTVTKVRGRPVCAGQVIFEDNFDVLREDLWQIEQYIPVDHPEHPFVSYQRLTSDANVFVENGTLHIVPKLQEDLLRPKNESIISGILDLTDGCTRRECYKAANGADMLPPVVSGRLTSNLAFTYGSVHVRAKLPQGDWLYPEILLEPLYKKYSNEKELTSILKIAVSDGNLQAHSMEDKRFLDIYGNAFLVGGPSIDKRCYQMFNLYKWAPKGATKSYWGDEFHNYTLQWKPEEITASVDGEEYMRIELDSTLRCFDAFLVPYMFSRHVQITLGVAAGGVVEFRDGALFGNYRRKPWRNGSPKASWTFWQDRAAWYSTWNQPGLIVDHIKVVAL